LGLIECTVAGVVDFCWGEVAEPGVESVVFEPGDPSTRRDLEFVGSTTDSVNVLFGRATRPADPVPK